MREPRLVGQTVCPSIQNEIEEMASDGLEEVDDIV